MKQLKLLWLLLPVATIYAAFYIGYEILGGLFDYWYSFPSWVMLVVVSFILFLTGMYKSGIE
jgi:hypothetical protein